MEVLHNPRGEHIDSPPEGTSSTTGLVGLLKDQQWCEIEFVPARVKARQFINNNYNKGGIPWQFSICLPFETSKVSKLA